MLANPSQYHKASINTSTKDPYERYVLGAFPYKTENKTYRA